MLSKFFLRTKKTVTEENKTSDGENQSNSLGQYPSLEKEETRPRSVSMFSPIQPQSKKKLSKQISASTLELASSTKPVLLKPDELIQSILTYLQVDEDGKIDLSVFKHHEWEFVKEIESQKHSNENSNFVEDYIRDINNEKALIKLYEKYLVESSKFLLNIDEFKVKQLREIVSKNEFAQKIQEVQTIFKTVIVPAVIELIKLNISNLSSVNPNLMNKAYKALVENVSENNSDKKKPIARKSSYFNLSSTKLGKAVRRNPVALQPTSQETILESEQTITPFI